MFSLKASEKCSKICLKICLLHCCTVSQTIVNNIVRVCLTSKPFFFQLLLEIKTDQKKKKMLYSQFQVNGDGCARLPLQTFNPEVRV